jgi:hypothetical protein
MLDNNIGIVAKPTTNNDVLQLPNKKKTVKFNPSLRVILIPSRGEFRQVGLNSVLWWSSSDYINFQNNANSEIRMLVSFENITAKQARRKLYQSSDIVDNDEFSNYNLINTNPSPRGQQLQSNFNEEENLSPNNNEKNKIIIKKVNNNNKKILERQDSLQNISSKSYLIKAQLNKSNNGSNNDNNSPKNKRDYLTLSVPVIEKMMVNFNSRSRTKKNNSSNTFYILGGIVILAAMYWF